MLIVSKHTIIYNWYCGLWTYLITYLGDRHDGRLVIISSILVWLYSVVHYITFYLMCVDPSLHRILYNPKYQ